MQEKPRLEVNEKPTIFNREGFMGAVLGSLFLAGLGTFALGALGITSAAGLTLGGIALGTATGGLIGGLVGKSRTEDEYKYGREVKPASIFNWDMLTGALGLFSLVTAGIAVGVATGAFAFADAETVKAFADSTKPLSDAAPEIRNVFYAAMASFVSPFVGAAGGSIYGYMRMDKDYKVAEQQAMVRGQSNEVQINRAVGGPTRSTALAYEQNPYMNMRQDHASRVVDERMAAAQMPNQKI